ncbi:NAD-dependent epimerase/dehydratase family protein [Haladaptatus caseinilyticus]|uniref:NAD-dependent epimerase/dehydratase family protein n=1 Tax=Haladaptatus caseinilyticus TaxID=2993314 RepID=UPI00224B913D|nr:SDR family NAD(P)-dependent oxidoreductase [Haladaptatus caseinilyticus]
MSWSEKTVAVTGGAGFLGSHLCEALIERGANVLVFDNSTTGMFDNLDLIRRDIEIVDCDVRDRESIADLGNADIVFHLAAVANPRTCKDNFDLAFDVNVTGTKNILETCRRNGCDRIVFTSTASVYGDPEYVPINESHPRHGYDPYAVTKKIGEDLCRNYYENYRLPVTIVRNFNLFGPKQERGYLIPTLIAQALDEGKIEIWNGKSSRDFMYVTNGVAALLEASTCDGLLGDVVNVGSGDEVSAGTLANQISQRFGNVPVEDLRKDTVGSRRLICDNQKLQKETGWKVEVPFEHGLEMTIEWFEERQLRSYT